MNSQEIQTIKVTNSWRLSPGEKKRVADRLRTMMLCSDRRWDYYRSTRYLLTNDELLIKMHRKLYKKYDKIILTNIIMILSMVKCVIV